MRRAFIYALCEPGTRVVRYIGLTYDLPMRLHQHITKTIKRKTHVGRWLAGVVKSGQVPHILVLREVNSEDGPFEEMRFIASAHRLGLRITNATDGGEGVIHPSKEAQEKFREILKKKWADPRYRARRAAAFATPESYAKRCAAAKAISERPEIQAASRARHKKLWSDPKFRAKNTALINAACSTPESHARRSEAQKKRCQTPEYSALVRARWADPIFRAKTIAAMKKAKQKKI